MKETKSRNTPPRCNKFVIASCLAVAFAVAFLVLFFHGNYPERILARILPQNEPLSTWSDDKTFVAWNTCLKQLHADVDIVFFGDSITRQAPYDTMFPNKVICNLGIGSDTLAGMASRTDMIGYVSPEKVFLMGGINSLRDDTLDQSVSEYGTLLENISANNSYDVYVLSILPISSETSSNRHCSSPTIQSFNEAIKMLAQQYGFTYIDLYSHFIMPDGFICPYLTIDGVHLTDSAYQIMYEIILPFISNV